MNMPQERPIEKTIKEVACHLQTLYEAVQKAVNCSNMPQLFERALIV